MGKSKSHFTKENSVTFKLVHRSQQDPLAADSSAPQNVLLPTNKGKRKSNRDEQIKFGIYFDDDYDYLQHLKDVDGQQPTVDWEPVSNKKKQKKPQIMLPSSVFASEVEEKEGLLNKAALPSGPQPNWDPDIVAALSDDFDFDNPENQLEDDFFVKMMGAEGGTEKEEAENDDDDDYEDVSDDDTIVSDQGSGRFSEEETKSCFTNYSMTSSVIRRNQGLTMLDDQFEALYEKEYADDTEIGGLAEGDVDGYIDVNKSEIIKKLIGDKKKDEEDRVYVNQMIGQKFRYQESDEPTVEIEVEDLDKQREPEYDCQSIISTYSNIYNHPKIIFEEKNSKKVKINPKTGIPVIPKPGLTAENLKQLDQDVDNQTGGGKSVRSIVSKVTELSIRDKNETPEERKARKEALKEYRRERRLEKKANKLCFKLEEKRQVKEVINLQQNLSAVKLC